MSPFFQIPNSVSHSLVCIQKHIENVLIWHK